MADVEADAALAGPQHSLFHLALRIDWCVGKWAKRVSQYVSRAQPVEDLLVAWRRMIDMGHERQTDFVGNLQSDIERYCARAARSMSPDAHLDADDNVAIGVRHLHCIERRQQAYLFAFPDHYAWRKSINACEGDVQKGKNAHCATLDH